MNSVHQRVFEVIRRSREEQEVLKKNGLGNDQHVRCMVAVEFPELTWSEVDRFITEFEAGERLVER